MSIVILNKEDKNKYEENLEEETKLRAQEPRIDGGQGLNKSLDLMKKLSDYLGY